jgi:hypothetical protein
VHGQLEQWTRPRTSACLYAVYTSVQVEEGKKREARNKKINLKSIPHSRSNESRHGVLSPNGHGLLGRRMVGGRTTPNESRENAPYHGGLNCAVNVWNFFLAWSFTDHRPGRFRLGRQVLNTKVETASLSLLLRGVVERIFFTYKILAALTGDTCEGFSFSCKSQYRDSRQTRLPLSQRPRHLKTP